MNQLIAFTDRTRALIAADGARAYYRFVSLRIIILEIWTGIRHDRA
jgi:hypothetical protein